jgi:hypothetical protein
LAQDVVHYTTSIDDVKYLLISTRQTLIIPANPPQPGFRFIYPDHNNWAPRVGFAYRMTSKSVIRGGFGIFYNPNQADDFTFLNLNPPFSSAATYTSLPTSPTLSLADPTPAGSANPSAPPNIITENWHLHLVIINFVGALSSSSKLPFTALLQLMRKVSMYSVAIH